MDLLHHDLKPILLCLFCFTNLITSPVEITKGVSSERLSLYEIRKNFTCLDGTLSIPSSYVNDDYCDCQDGTDEPGTSACPNGIFHCWNKGHVPKDIPSSFVNDGISDCCDGSDEYEGTNVCDRLSQEDTLNAERTNELLEKGSILRADMAVLGELILKEKRKRKAQLEKEKVEVELLVAELARKKSSSARQQTFKRQKDIQKTKAQKNTYEAFVSQKGQIEPEKSKKHFSQPGNEERIEFGDALEDYNSRINNNTEFQKYIVHDESFMMKISPDDHDKKNIKIKEEKTELLTQGRVHYLSTLRRKQTINQQLFEVKTFLSKDYGLEQEFATLNGQCFSFSDPMYLYELCPFVNVTQLSKTEINEILLGTWAGWAEKNHGVMIYDNGQPCLGVKRSARVTIKCGLINEIENVKESNRCEYSIIYQTPAACKSDDNVHNIHSEL